MNNNLAFLNQDRIILNGNFAQEFINRYSSKPTQREYIRIIKDFFQVEELSQIKLSQVENIYSTQVDNYLKSISHLSASSINKHISALRSFVDYVNYLGAKCNVEVPNLFKSKFVKDIISNNTIKKEKSIEILTHEEVDRFFSVITLPRDKVLFELFLQTGLRRSEVLTLTKDSIIEDDGEYYLSVIGKGRKQREVWIPEELVNDLLTLGNTEKFFPMTSDNIYKRFIKYLEKANIRKKVSPHSLRHTVATEARENGATVEEIQDMLGHSSPIVTDRYIKRLEKRRKSATRKVNLIKRG